MPRQLTESDVWEQHHILITYTITTVTSLIVLVCDTNN